MEYRTLDLTLVSAKGIKKASLIGKPDVYAVVYISGARSNQKLRTPVDKDGGSDPTWNFPLSFTVDEAAGLQNRLTLVVKIKAVGIFSDKNLGEVRVPIKELLEGVSIEGKTQQLVSYQVRTKSGKTKGFLSFSYKFGEKFSGKAEEPVTAYPPGMAVGSSSAYAQPYGAAAAAGGYYQPPATGYPHQPQTGYAYQHQQQPGYGGYPPPPPPGYGGYPPQQGYGNPAVQQPPKKSKFGMGLGAGLLGGALGGLLIGDIVSDAADGGGCGGDGGGCGGGCGGF
ncbi:hypothetical protein Lser_V15G27973 [Lactuca serriola]